MFWNDKTKENMEDWYAKFPIGKKINYCGKKLIIKKNWVVYLGSGIEPCIGANYLDNNGCIKYIEFSKTQANELFGRSK